MKNNQIPCFVVNKPRHSQWAREDRFNLARATGGSSGPVGEGLMGQLNYEKSILLVKVSEFELTRQSFLYVNENLKGNIISFKDNDNLKLKVTQLERELDKAKFIKVDLKNRSKKLTHMLTGPIRFSNDKSGLDFDKFASNSNFKKKVFKKNLNFVKAYIENNFVKRKLIRQIQAIIIFRLTSHTQ
ncbi:hypothetical protein LguiA_024946 [Lonicera macranthoides]